MRKQLTDTLMDFNGVIVYYHFFKSAIEPGAATFNYIACKDSEIIGWGSRDNNLDFELQVLAFGLDFDTFTIQNRIPFVDDPKLKHLVDVDKNNGYTDFYRPLLKSEIPELLQPYIK